jgi:hypothetical protein
MSLAILPFPFLEFSQLVDAKGVESKLSSLRVDCPTTRKKGWNSLLGYRNQGAKFKKSSSERFII